MKTSEAQRLHEAAVEHGSTITIKDNCDGTATIVAKRDRPRRGTFYDKDVDMADLDSEAQFLTVLMAGGAV